MNAKLRSNFEIVSVTKKPEYGARAVLTIRDVGPWDKFMTVTNDIENVVDHLFATGQLKPGERLMAIDSDGYCDEIIIGDDNRFKAFAPGEPQ